MDEKEKIEEVVEDNATIQLDPPMDEVEEEDVTINEDIPLVAPPTVKTSETNSYNEDERILKPIGMEEPAAEEVVEEKNEEVKLDSTNKDVPVTDVPNQLPNVIVDNNGENKEILENKKMPEVKIEYKPPGFFKKLFVFLIFASLILLIIFLPEVTEYIENLKNNNGNDYVPEQTTKSDSGKLTCTYDSSDDKYDYVYSYEFLFDSNKIETLNYKFTKRGDKAQDAVELNADYDNCKLLSNEIAAVENIGVKITCDWFEGTITETQNIELEQIDSKKVNEIFDRYGIPFQDYEYQANVDEVKASLKAEKYECNLVYDEATEK